MKLTWEPEWREEYDALLDEVVSVGTNTSARLNEFERLLNDAVQAHKPWARDVERTCIRAGLAKEVKAFQDRTRAAVSYDGEVLSLPRVQSRRIIDHEGKATHDRALIELWSWSEIIAKRVEAKAAGVTSANRMAFYDKLLALRGLCPESASPQDAADRLGLDLDEFLGREAVA